MTKAKTKAKEDRPLPELNRVFDLIVVGAGPAGLRAIEAELAKNSSASILCLEATDRLGGRARSGLHLVPASLSSYSALKLGLSLGSAKIRWEREWVSPDQVDWTHKDWPGKLPQWDLYFREPMAVVQETATQNSIQEIPESVKDRVTFQLNCPVSKLTASNDTSVDGWQFETSLGTFVSQRAVWAAGLTAFQNAVGKKEAQSAQVANPFHNDVADDFRGGIALSLHFDQRPEFEDGFPDGGIFGLPVKHGGSYHLILGCLQPGLNDGWDLLTLTHVHRDILAQPQDVMGFQKSLRRALKSLLKTNAEASSESPDVIPAKTSEKWVVSDRVMGHAFGTPWLLGAGIGETLVFAGDECVLACSATRQDTAGVLQASLR